MLSTKNEKFWVVDVKIHKNEPSSMSLIRNIDPSSILLLLNAEIHVRIYYLQAEWLWIWDHKIQRTQLDTKILKMYHFEKICRYTLTLCREKNFEVLQYIHSHEPNTFNPKYVFTQCILTNYLFKGNNLAYYEIILFCSMDFYQKTIFSCWGNICIKSKLIIIFVTLDTFSKWYDYGHLRLKKCHTPSIHNSTRV